MRRSVSTARWTREATATARNIRNIIAVGKVTNLCVRRWIVNKRVVQEHEIGDEQESEEDEGRQPHDGNF